MKQSYYTMSLGPIPHNDLHDVIAQAKEQHAEIISVYPAGAVNLAQKVIQPGFRPKTQSIPIYGVIIAKRSPLEKPEPMRFFVGGEINVTEWQELESISNL